MARFELDKNSLTRQLGRSVNLLIELSHSYFEQTYYFINNTKAINIDGQEYMPFPFDLTLPAQTENVGTQITISNVDTEISRQIKKTVFSNENIVLKLYIANIETDFAEKIDFGIYEITEPTITLEGISAEINIRHSLNFNVGTIRYNRQLFPNLYL